MKKSWQEGGRQQPTGPGPMTENLFPPEFVMAHQRAIDLSDAQKAYIRVELLKAQTRFTELQWQLQDAMEALVALLKQSSADESQVFHEKALMTRRAQGAGRARCTSNRMPGCWCGLWDKHPSPRRSMNSRDCAATFA